MYEIILEELEAMFPGKSFLTTEDVCGFLGCDITVVYNWNKRSDPKRRPPSMPVGKGLRFQKKIFAKWLVQKQERRNFA